MVVVAAALTAPPSEDEFMVTQLGETCSDLVCGPAGVFDHIPASEPHRVRADALRGCETVGEVSEVAEEPP